MIVFGVGAGFERCRPDAKRQSQPSRTPRKRNSSTAGARTAAESAARAQFIAVGSAGDPLLEGVLVSVVQTLDREDIDPEDDRCQQRPGDQRPGADVGQPTFPRSNPKSDGPAPETRASR